MGQGRHTPRSISDPVYPHVLYNKKADETENNTRQKISKIED